MTLAFAITDNVIVAVVGAAGLVLIEWMRRQNTRQHGASVEGFQEMRTEVMAELRDVKADVRAVKDDVRDLDGKFDDLSVIGARRHEENVVHLEALDGATESVDKHIALVDTAVTDLTGQVGDLTGRVDALTPPGGTE